MKVQLGIRRQLGQDNQAMLPVLPLPRLLQGCSDSTLITRIYCADWALCHLLPVTVARVGRMMGFGVPRHE